ncbi:MAG: hypothetical protein ACE5E5_12050 [Phycisphaerae bacterium]
MQTSCLTAAALAALVPGPAWATVYHVDAGAPAVVRDGLTWETAFVRLEDALSVAFFLDEIRVAGGTYTPDPTGLVDPRSATFLLPADVHVIGGFAGHAAADPNLRDLVAYETILSGDLNGDDRQGGDNSDNCRNVVTATELTGTETVFEGFTITGGNATAVFVPPFFPFGYPGGGMFVVGSRTLIDCTFRDNCAKAGGGLFSFEGSMALTRCVFEHNRATEGGALGLFGTDDPSPPFGGTDDRGTIAHGTPTLIDCLFRDNHAVERAGAVWVDGIAENPTFRNCRWLGNRVDADGAALWSGGGFCELVNCLFSGNTAGQRGGAVYSDTLTTFRNCSIVGNRAHRGGGLFNPFIRSTLINTILWDNTSETATGESAQAAGDFLPPITSFSCVAGWTGAWGGQGNFGADPLFVPGPAGCYYLGQTAAGHATDSPCKDAGSESAINLGLADATTRSDEVTDSGIADLGFHYPVTGNPLIPADSNHDGAIDLRDVAAFQACFGGTTTQPVPPCCRIFDAQPDGFVDLVDHSWMVEALGTP